MWRINTAIETSLETRFDARRGTATAGTQYLDIASAVEAGTVGYAGTRERELRFLIWMLCRLTGEREFDQFIDIGAGRGKACIIAAESGVFRETIAVENDESLIRAATDNAGATGLCFRVVHTDARDVASYLEGDSDQVRVFYLYNPFSVDILEEFLVALNQVTGPKYLVYNNGKDQRPLTRQGWVRLWHWQTPMLVGRRRNPMSIWRYPPPTLLSNPERP